MVRLLELFEGNQIPAVAYKGPAIGVGFYRNLALFGLMEALKAQQKTTRPRWSNNNSTLPGIMPTQNLRWIACDQV